MTATRGSGSAERLGSHPKPPVLAQQPLPSPTPPFTSVHLHGGPLLPFWQQPSPSSSFFHLLPRQLVWEAGGDAQLCSQWAQKRGACCLPSTGWLRSVWAGASPALGWGLETEDLPSGDLPGGSVVKTSPSNAGAVGSFSGWGGKIPQDSWPNPPPPLQKKEDSRAGRKGHAERSMYTVKSTLEKCLGRCHIRDPQYSFLSELKETITDKAANFHLGATLPKPTSHICKRWNWAQHQERPALEGSPGTATGWGAAGPGECLQLIPGL